MKKRDRRGGKGSAAAGKLRIQHVATWEGEALVSWNPPDPNRVAEELRVHVSYGTEPGSVELGVHVFTPSALVGVDVRGGVLFAGRAVVLQRWDKEVLMTWIRETLRECEAGTFVQCLEKLRRYFSHEQEAFNL